MHIVCVTLPVRERDKVGLRVPEVHPDTVPVEQAIGVLVTVRVPDWLAIAEGVVVMDAVNEGVVVPDPQALKVPLEVEDFRPDTVGESVPLGVEEDVWDSEVLEDPDTVEDKHKVGVGLTDVVVDEDAVAVLEVQGEGERVDEEQ